MRAYGATKLFQSHVPEKVIQQRTGHRSLDALRLYEQTTESQLSNCISNASTPLHTNSCSPMSQVSKHESHISSTPTATATPTVVGNPTPPTVVINGCTFSGCAISMSGQAVNNNNMDELFQGIDINQIFDD